MVQVISENNNYYESCHELNQNSKTGKVALAMANTGAWHDLGTVVSGAMSGSEALQLGGLADWRLDKIEHTIPQLDMSLNGGLGGTSYLPTGCHSVVRGDTGQLLTQGTSVGKNYTIVSNEELFGFLDDVLSGIGASYETVGALGNGEKVWLLARYAAGDFTIGKTDETKAYMLLSSSHDGSSSIQVFPTDTRVVCANTHRIAHRKANGQEQRYSMRHTQNVSKNIAEATRMLGLAASTFAEFAVQAEAMSKKMIGPEALFDRFVDETTSNVEIAGITLCEASLRDGSILAAIDTIKDREQRFLSEKSLLSHRDKRAKLVSQLMERYESETCQTGAPGSLWAGFNAITETIDHGDILRFQGGEQTRKESRFASLIYGKGDIWKQLALTTALDFLAV